MKEDDFRAWLESKGMDSNAVSSRVSSVKRVNQVVDDLEGLALDQSRESFLEPYTYTSEDKRLGKPNPSPLSFSEGADLYNGLSSIGFVAQRPGEGFISRIQRGSWFA